MKKFLIFGTVLIVVMALISCTPTMNFMPKSILIDDSHNNQFGYVDENFFGTMINTLEAENYQVDFTSDVGFAPDQYDILIIPTPVSLYSNTEVNQVKNFVQNGNKIIVLGEFYSYYDNSELNYILNQVGADIQFDNSFISDAVNNYDNDSQWPEINLFNPHPTTESVNSIVLFAASSLNVTGNAIKIAESSTINLVEPLNSSSYNEDGSMASIGKKQNYDSLTTTYVSVAAVEKIGNGKIIAVSDVNLFSDDVDDFIPSIDSMLNVADNKDFLLNIVKW